jgi:two-component system OmpR family sensor kinase
MFKSLRWRLQVWHALVLLTVLTSFGGLVHSLHWQTRLQQIDAELDRASGMVMSQLRRLLPRPQGFRPPGGGRRIRRPEDAGPETETQAQAPARPSEAVAALPQRPEPARAQDPSRNSGPESPQTSGPESSRSNGPETPRGNGRADNPPAGSDNQAPPRRDRAFPDPGPLPKEFQQLFDGDEESRLYFVIWGGNGDLLQKSEFAPNIAYPNLHIGADGIPQRVARSRPGDHLYREVIHAGMWDMNLLVGRSLEKDLAAYHRSGFLLIAAGLVILAAGVLGGGWLSSRAIRPIADMAATAESISAQNLSERIDVKETVSELGQLGTVLNRTFDRLEAAFERQSQFTADASHELRTPLSVISTNTELALSRPRSEEEYCATLDTCRRASQRMRSLIDALLLLARFDSGTPSLKQDCINLDPLLRDCAELVEPMAAERKVLIDCKSTSCHVQGDRDRLSQVVTNLLTNAIRYNVEGGRVHVATRTEGNEVILQVIDTGVGIAEDQLPHIFDRFYQVDKVRSRADGSCGLGLSICKTIVEAHGGTIVARSQSGVGTTIEVRLPKAVRPEPGKVAVMDRESSLVGAGSIANG